MKSYKKKTAAEINAVMTELRKLAKKRDSHCPLPPEYRHIHEFHDGQYATNEFVLPYTKAACNLNADVMLILQDWSSVDVLAGSFDSHQAQTGQSLGFRTNENLRAWLKKHLGLRFCDTYATDVVPFAKPGGKSAKLCSKMLSDCALQYTKHEIELIRPCVALCFGGATYRAVFRAFHSRYPTKPFNNEYFDISHTISQDPCVTRIVHMSHPAASTTREDRLNEWTKAREHLNELCPEYPKTIAGPNRQCPLHHQQPSTCQNECI